MPRRATLADIAARGPPPEARRFRLRGTTIHFREIGPPPHALRAVGEARGAGTFALGLREADGTLHGFAGDAARTRAVPEATEAAEAAGAALSPGPHEWEVELGERHATWRLDGKELFHVAHGPRAWHVPIEPVLRTTGELGLVLSHLTVDGADLLA